MIHQMVMMNPLMRRQFLRQLLVMLARLYVVVSQLHVVVSQPGMMPRLPPLASTCLIAFSEHSASNQGVSSSSPTAIQSTSSVTCAPPDPCAWRYRSGTSATFEGQLAAVMPVKFPAVVSPCCAIKTPSW